MKVTRPEVKAAAFPDLKAASDEDLLKHLTSPSHVCRLATQQEILKRGSKPAFVAGLEKMAESDQPLAVKVAAIFTLKQLEGAKSQEAMFRLAAKDDVREYALRALADRKTQLVGLEIKPFVAALGDPNPRVRLQAVTALARLGKPEASDSLVPLTADADPIVSHVAINTLVLLNGVDACLKGIDSSSPTLLPGSLRALQAMHDSKAVDGLITRLDKAQDPALRQGILRTLARLCFKEADWDGKWWSTRPDTTGPYYKLAEWSDTSKIRERLKAALTSEKPDVLRGYIVDLQKNRVDLPELNAMLVKAATQDPAFRDVVVQTLDLRANVSDEMIGVLRDVALSDKEAPAMRAKSMRILWRNSGKPAAMEAVVNGLTAIQGLEKPDIELAHVYDEATHDNKNAQNVQAFVKLADDESPAKRELAYAILMSLANGKLSAKPAKDQAAKVIDAAWQKPEALLSVLRAVGRTKSDSYLPQVREHLKDSNKDVQQAAAFAVERLNPQAAGSQKGAIENLAYDKALGDAVKAKGDAKAGAELFTKLGCIACHTTSADQPPKGPFLGGIATRYSRPELIESILKPSAKISQGFETQWFTLKDDTDQEGFVVRESGTEVEIRNVQGLSSTIKKADIKERGKRDKSVMPDGLADKITPQDLGSLLAYLESLPSK